PRPVRSRFTSDTDPTVLLATSSASGALSGAQLSADLRTVTAYYDPGPGETSAVFRASATLAATDWSSSNPAAPSLIAGATAALALVGDGMTRSVASNALGATLTFDGDPGRVVLPRGAFAVDAASSVAVSFTRSASPAAFAAAPPPAPLAGSLYDVALPPGVPTALARPAELTLAYSTSVADPSRLHVYWYNPAAGAYILQPDAAGGALVVDASARTVALKVNHFSTYVLLDSAAGVIGGSAFAGGDLDAYNFPNPFDLSVKTVTTIHGGGSPSIRGTLVRVSVPPGLSGQGTFRVFDITGRLIRTVDLGALAGGQIYYQAWDGSNDAGSDVASGLYLGQVELGSRRKTFKMAVLK
ncbi:MAG: FlgD immunoglobulin-like domain containing protein, partial [Elusimicrobiota bacterium]